MQHCVAISATAELLFRNILTHNKLTVMHTLSLHTLHINRLVLIYRREVTPVQRGTWRHSWMQSSVPATRRTLSQ